MAAKDIYDRSGAAGLPRFDGLALPAPIGLPTGGTSWLDSWPNAGRAEQAAKAAAEEALEDLVQSLLAWHRPVSFHSGGYYLGRTTVWLFGDQSAGAVGGSTATPETPDSEKAPTQQPPISSGSSWVEGDSFPYRAVAEIASARPLTAALANLATASTAAAMGAQSAPTPFVEAAAIPEIGSPALDENGQVTANKAAGDLDQPAVSDRNSEADEWERLRQQARALGLDPSGVDAARAGGVNAGEIGEKLNLYAVSQQPIEGYRDLRGDFVPFDKTPNDGVDRGQAPQVELAFEGPGVIPEPGAPSAVPAVPDAPLAGEAGELGAELGAIGTATAEGDAAGALVPGLGWIADLAVTAAGATAALGAIAYSFVGKGGEGGPSGPPTLDLTKASDDPHIQLAYRIYLANGGSDSIEDWFSLGRPTSDDGLAEEPASAEASLGTGLPQSRPSMAPDPNGAARGYGDIPVEQHWRYDRYLASRPVRVLDPDAWYAKARTAWKNNTSGNAFEMAARKAAVAPTGRGSKPLSIQGYVPDLPVGPEFGVTDVKNVVDLSNSGQLRAFHRYAVDNKLPFNLIIGPRTETISEPLLDNVRETGGKVMLYDPITNRFSPVDIGRSGPWIRR
ncbi:MAG: putative toxin [Aliidongia sp.]